MFKSIALFAVLFVAATSAGLIESHHVVQPVVAKVVHSSPSAVSHSSFTRVHNKAVLHEVVAPVVKTVHQPIVPVVKTVATPIVHAAPVSVVHAAAPVVHHAAPVVHTYAADPVLHHSVPVVHTAPVVKTFVPAAYTLHHH